MFQLAADSVQVLSGAFFDSIWGRTATTPADLAGACPITDGKTLWYFASTDTNDPCAGLDWYILGYLTLVVHVISWGIRWTVWEPGARAIARSTKHPTFDRQTQRKVSTSLTECLFFVLSGFFAFRLFAGEAWLYEPNTWLHGRDELPVAAAVKFYYLLYAARFVSDFISLFFEIGRSATTLLVSCIHHAVTLGLIAIAVRGNYIRGGAVM